MPAASRPGASQKSLYVPWDRFTLIVSTIPLAAGVVLGQVPAEVKGSLQIGVMS